MRRALRKAGWALAAAGGIGIAGPAAAQAVRVIGPGGHVEQAGEAVVITEGQARLEEAQVELGLLADPMLFSYGLGAHVQGTTVEVRGFVPNEAAHEQAIKVAHEQTELHVVDKLKIMPNLATRGSVEKPEVIQRDAKSLLEEAVPQYGRGIDVKCDARGRVTVSGSVGSIEDRLVVSRKLRQVNGCSCVVNQLDVVTAKGEALSAEATGAVHIPDAAPVTTRPAVRKTETDPFSEPVPARTVSVPHHNEVEAPSPFVPRRDTGTVVVPAVPPAPSHPKEIEAPSLAMPRVYQEPVAPLPPPPVPTPAVKPLPELPPVVKPVPPPVPVSIDVTPLPRKVEVPPPLPRPEPHLKVPPSSIDKDRPYGGGTAGAPTLDLPPAPPPKPAPPVKLPVVVNEPAVPAPKPPPLPPVVPLTPPRPAVTPLPKLPAIDSKHDRGGSEESYVSEGTITLDDDPPAAKPVVPAKAPPPLPTGGAKVPPYAPVKPAEGTMSLTPPPMPPSRPAADPTKLSAPSAKPPAPPAPPRPIVPPAVRLKERIQGVIGPAFEVKVTASGKNQLRLEITGHVAGEDQRVMKQIKPVVGAEEFRGLEINIDVVTPVK